MMQHGEKIGLSCARKEKQYSDGVVVVVAYSVPRRQRHQAGRAATVDSLLIDDDNHDEQHCSGCGADLWMQGRKKERPRWTEYYDGVRDVAVGSAQRLAYRRD